MEQGINEQALEERLGTLETARTWSPRVVSRLEALIRSGDDESLFRINPIRFAAERNMAEAEAVDLFLHATAIGLFTADWLLLCPMCACVVESFGSLRSVNNHYHCPMCRSDYEAMLDDYIAVGCTVSPDIRPIAFHHPEGLPAKDYAFNYKGTGCQIECRTPEGVPWTELVDAVTRAVSYLPAHATTRLDVEASEGLLFAFDVDSDAGFLFRVSGQRSAELQVVPVQYPDGRCKPAHGEIAPGRVTFEVENGTGRRGLLGIAALPADFTHRPLTVAPFLTGKRLLTTQTFRDLFRSELIRATEGIGVRDIALVFADLKGSTALYDRIGDLNAFALVQQHFERLLDVTVRHGGAVIKTLGDAVMAAFLTPADAVEAAIAIRDEIERFNDALPGHDLILKVGVHKGASIAVTLNERLDYFGQTVNIAARVQALAAGNEICLSGDVYEHAGIRELLGPFPVERDLAHLRGVHQEMRVFRVGMRATAEDATAAALGAQ